MNRPANSPAQINYRNAKASTDAAEAAFDAVNCEDLDAMNAAEAAFDAASIAEEEAGTELIQWMRSVIIAEKAPAEALVAVDAALAGDRRFRARILDLAEAVAA